MKILHCLTLALIITCAMPEYSSSYPWQSAQVKEQALGFSNLALTIDVPKKELLQLEPISLTLSVRNETSRPVLGHTLLEFSHKYTEIVVFHNGSKRTVTNLSSSITSSFVRTSTIEPGEHYQVRQQLAYGLGNIFPEAGDYQIQAIFYNLDRKEHLESNLVTIRVLEPTKVDREAFNYINSIGPASDFFSGSAFPDTALQLRIMEDLLSNFRNSVYADYAASLLGRIYFGRNDFEKAASYFERLASSSKFPNVDETIAYLVEAHAKLQNPDKVARYVDILRNRYPNSIYTRKAERYLPPNTR